MLKKILLTILSFAAGAGLVYFGLKMFLSPEQVMLMAAMPLEFHLVSVLLLLPVAFLGGIETFALFRLVYGKSIGLYDTLTLPFVINLWGFLLPVQGAYLYNSVYFKAKYKIFIVNTTSVYLLSLSVSFILAGILGIVYSFSAHFNSWFLALSCFAIVHPVFVFLLLQPLRALKNISGGLLQSALEKAETIFADYTSSFSAKVLGALSAINLANSLLTAVWSYWIAQGLGLGLSFFQLLILAGMLKLMVLLKFTPGNVGVNQFASSGIILLAGGAAADGFALSLYQTAIIIIAAFSFGTLFSFINMKYFFNSSPTEKRTDLRELYRKEYVDNFDKNEGAYRGKISNIMKHISVSPNDVVADYACGNGLLARVIHGQVKEYHGVDFSSEFIESFRERIKKENLKGNIQIYCEDINKFCKQKPDYFDKAFTFDFSEHIYDEDFMKIYASVFLSLKPGGTLFIHTPNAEFIIEIFKEKGIMQQFPEHVAVRNAKTYRRMLSEIGYQNIKIQFLPHYYFLLRYLHPFSFIPLIGKYLKARLLISCSK